MIMQFPTHESRGQNSPDGRAAQVFALDRSIRGESIVLVTGSPDAEITRHLAAQVVALRAVRR
jgi:hypothetical protein